LPKDKLISARINRSEEAQLNSADIRLLQSKRFNLIVFYILPYFILVFIGFLKLGEGVHGLYGRRRYLRPKFDEEDVMNFKVVAPYFILGLIVIATIYFIKLYFKDINPLTKDLRNQKKSLLFYEPVKSEMSYFNKYFISTPLFKRQQFEISREDFMKLIRKMNCVSRLHQIQLRYYDFELAKGK
jgi:hypothetical protein